MQIVAVRWRHLVKATGAVYPRLILEQGRGWTDIAPPDETVYETLYDVYLEEAFERRTLLGSIKILKVGQPVTHLRGEMESLPDDCCSLGQTIDYYEAVEKLGAPTCGDILRALRDVTANPSVASAFEREPGFSISLLRFSEAKRIYHYRGRQLHREPPPREPVRLSFETSLPGFSPSQEERHTVSWEFHPEPGCVGRLAALVGENGTGKTSLLARLAAALWGLHRESERIAIDGPPVGRVIAVSYSALDAFDRPPPYLARSLDGERRPVMHNYTYCGFRDRNGELRPAALFDALGEDLGEIKRLDRWSQWTQMLAQTRLADDPDLQAALDAPDLPRIVEVVRNLGAGQKTVLSVMTRLLASLRNGALVLFDEPELNLHPSLLAATLRVLHDWLDDYDGYGIVATHSPIVLQEIPGRNVRVLRRVGRAPVVQPFDGESFGEGLPEIVNRVFGVDERDKNYVAVFRALLSKGMSPEQIEASFGRKLSPNARMALRALARGVRHA